MIKSPPNFIDKPWLGTKYLPLELKWEIIKNLKGKDFINACEANEEFASLIQEHTTGMMEKVKEEFKGMINIRPEIILTGTPYAIYKKYYSYEVCEEDIEFLIDGDYICIKKTNAWEIELFCDNIYFEMKLADGLMSSILYTPNNEFPIEISIHPTDLHLYARFDYDPFDMANILDNVMFPNFEVLYENVTKAYYDRSLEDMILKASGRHRLTATNPHPSMITLRIEDCAINIDLPK